MLSQTLHALERDGLVHREAQPTNPPRVDYALTPLGHEVARPAASADRPGGGPDAAGAPARERYDAGTPPDEPGPRRRAVARGGRWQRGQK